MKIDHMNYGSTNTHIRRFFMLPEIKEQALIRRENGDLFAGKNGRYAIGMRTVIAEKGALLALSSQMVPGFMIAFLGDSE